MQMLALPLLRFTRDEAGITFVDDRIYKLIIQSDGVAPQ